MRFGRHPSVALAAVLLLVAGCKKGTSTGGQPAGEQASPPVDPGPRCTQTQPGAVFLIGEPGPAATDGERAEIALPFGPEPGDAVGYADGFAVSALQTRDGGQGAVVALVSADAGRGQIVDLGAVSGSVDPPSLAASEQHLVAVVADGARTGRRLRLATLRGDAPRARVHWGGELHQGEGDSQSIGVAVGASGGVVAWDEYDPDAERGTVRVSTFVLDDPGAEMSPATVSPATSDVEAVQVARRPGGYWVAWISHTSYPVAEPAEDGGAGPLASAATPSPSASAPAFGSLVDLGPRWLEVMALDEDGAAASAPVVVTEKEAHVLVFDLAAGPDGSAWLAWRDDRTSPGAEKRSVSIARVRPDGARDRHVVRDEQLGAGAPSLIVDSAPTQSLPRAWLVLDSVEDVMRIAALNARGRLQHALAPEPLIRRAEPMALRAGGLLLARPRGRAVELSVVTCRVETRLPVEAGAAEGELPPFEPPPVASP